MTGLKFTRNPNIPTGLYSIPISLRGLRIPGLTKLEFEDVILHCKEKIEKNLLDEKYEKLDLHYDGKRPPRIEKKVIKCSKRNQSGGLETHDCHIWSLSNELIDLFIERLKAESSEDLEARVVEALMRLYRRELGSWRNTGECENILPMYGFSDPLQVEGDHLPTLVMHNKPKLSFLDFLEQKGLSEKKKLKLVLDIACALEYLHARGVTGLRLQPSSIAIEELRDGNIKAILCQFGSYDIIFGSEEREQERAGIAYASPEDCDFESLSRVTHQTWATSYSDMWSFGCIFAAVMHEAMLWGATHIGKIIEKLKRGEHPPATWDMEELYPEGIYLSHPAKEVKLEYWELIKRCWKPKEAPENRITAKEMCSILRNMYRDAQE